MIVNPENVAESTGSNYPRQFKSAVAGRVKKRLGNAAGLKNFGVNLVRLVPGSCSALRHWHSCQDEFIYVLEGEVTLVTNSGEQVLKSGMAAGFPAGDADGHHLVNPTDSDVVYLEIGDRTDGDSANYPDDDLIANASANGWIFTHKNGEVYED
ncbi:MAG: cupin domain-containing protein [Tychonema bourrellyi B0820]|uniref:Cupin domain-containing protein n=1 Tax=Tychonema bourrellyi FEM_GT703 TaxID=2040638 RepID=A0A2G4F0P0_9CYAN|nr:cupin domain-containing protein [Tychonema bourrellyi]MDQ2097380.1 cupin domain-containing protein [Tychonema bourrellyi B0820]PHX55334.1 cupin domain-containing protein [Tychonema bourrellyi FEM_GT703]